MTQLATNPNANLGHYLEAMNAFGNYFSSAKQAFVKSSTILQFSNPRFEGLTDLIHQLKEPRICVNLSEGRSIDYNSTFTSFEVPIEYARMAMDSLVEGGSIDISVEEFIPPVAMHAIDSISEGPKLLNDYDCLLRITAEALLALMNLPYQGSQNQNEQLMAYLSREGIEALRKLTSSVLPSQVRANTSLMN